MLDTLVPGALVRHPDRPDWGLGQVQSVIGYRVTVNFRERGKVLINTEVIALEAAEEPPADQPGPTGDPSAAGATLR